MESNRPDPDQLLAQVKAAAAREQRGRLKIFFGASAGVGKTFSMLAAAQALRRGGTDVVVGLLETHGRAETAALLTGLELLPPLMLDVRGTLVKEFDLDAALKRHRYVNGPVPVAVTPSVAVPPGQIVAFWMPPIVKQGGARPNRLLSSWFPESSVTVSVPACVKPA